MEGGIEGIEIPQYSKKDSYQKMKDVLGVDIREQSGTNLAKLVAEVGEMSNDEQVAFQTIFQEPFVLQHERTNFAAVREAGALRSADQLDLVRGKGKGGHTLGEDYQRWGNTDFVFFHMKPRDPEEKAVTEGKHFTVLTFEPDILFKEGWISFDDWHNFRAGSSNTKYFGEIERKITFTENNKIYEYIHSDGTTTSLTKTPVEEAFFNGNIKQALALSFIRDSRLIGKGFQKKAFQDRNAVIGSFNRLFQVEAKVPREVPLTMLIKRGDRIV